MMVDFDELDYDQARVAKEQLEETMATPGWELILRFLEQRAELRERELYEMMPANTEDMVKFAAFKGGIAELRLFGSMMEQVRNDLHEEVRRAQDALAAEEEME